MALGRVDWGLSSASICLGPGCSEPPVWVAVPFVWDVGGLSSELLLVHCWDIER